MIRIKQDKERIKEKNVGKKNNKNGIKNNTHWRRKKNVYEFVVFFNFLQKEKKYMSPHFFFYRGSSFPLLGLNFIKS